MQSAFLFTYTAVILTGFSLGVAAFIFLERSSDLKARWLAVYALCVALWIGSNAMADVQGSHGPLVFWSGLAFLGATWSVTVYLYFIESFITEKWPNRWLGLLYSLPSIITTPFIFSKHSVAESYFPEGVPTQILPGKIYDVLTYFLFLGLLFGSIKLLLFIRKKASPIQKIQGFYLQAGFIILFAGMATFNLILPHYGEFRFYTLGTQFTLVFIIFAGYAILRLGLLDIKILLSQILIFLLLAATFTGIITADSAFDLWRSVIAFAFTGVTGAYLLDSVKREVQRREELQIVTTRLSKTNADLREADKAKTEFLSIASHQLRTPLTVMKGYLSLMREGAYGKMPTDALAKAGHVYEMNERMIQSINNLLNATRIEKKRIEYTISEVDPNLALSELSSDMHFKAEQTDRSFVFAAKDKELPMVRADGDKMREVLSNLIDNAFKYTPKGGTITLDAEYKRNEGVVHFTVSDSGMGMSPEESKNLFQQFYRTETQKTSGIEGTGIGLYICRTFAEGMGGKVWLDWSEVGKGSTFAFTLPVARKE